MIIMASFLLLLILAGVWIFLVEPNWIKREKLNLNLEKELPPSLKELRFVQLSDLHPKRFGHLEEKVLKILREIKPDFIFITGDIVDQLTRDFENCQRFWQKLSQIAPGRTFVVLGNHEHRNPYFPKLVSLFEKSGFKVLNNQAEKISLGADSFWLIGVDDPHSGFDELEKTMKGVASEDLKILLAHSPEIFQKLKKIDQKVDLVLTGHTHGGQINIPGLVNLVLPLKYDKKYKRGLFREKEIYLYVNRGVGTTVLPLRFNAFPEITLIKLN